MQAVSKRSLPFKSRNQMPRGKSWRRRTVQGTWGILRHLGDPRKAREEKRAQRSRDMARKREKVVYTPRLQTLTGPAHRCPWGKPLGVGYPWEAHSCFRKGMKCRLEANEGDDKRAKGRQMWVAQEALTHSEASIAPRVH